MSQAYWFSSKWRFRFIDRDGDTGSWVHPDTLADAKADAVDRRLHIQVQRRAGRKASGYHYVAYGFVDPAGKAKRSTSLTLEQYVEEVKQNANTH